MMTGVITPDREAVIRLRVRGPGGQEEEVEAVIDTGFNDFFTLSTLSIAALNLPFEGPAQAMLADGSVVSMNYYRATVAWDAQYREIPVLEADGGPLVGMALLYGKRLTLDVVDGGPATIETLP